MEIEVTETVNQESDILIQIWKTWMTSCSVCLVMTKALTWTVADSEASSGDEGNSNDEANSDDDPMGVDSNVELFVYICVSSMCCFALQQCL